MVEALIFAQYPQAEIKIAEDYTKLLPAEFDPSRYDVSGTEFVFTTSAYPIKSWTRVRRGGRKDEYARLDPLAPLLEIMSALSQANICGYNMSSGPREVIGSKKEKGR